MTDDAIKKLLDPFGCHKHVALWLDSGTYRSLVHRHNDTFLAVDESEQKMMRADTIPLLSDALLNWPQDAEVLEKDGYGALNRCCKMGILDRAILCGLGLSTDCSNIVMEYIEELRDEIKRLKRKLKSND